MAARRGSRNALNDFLTDRYSYWSAPGDGDDPSKGVPIGADSSQDETRVRFHSIWFWSAQVGH